MTVSKKATIAIAATLSISVLAYTHFSSDTYSCDQQIHQQSIQAYDQCVAAQQSTMNWSHWLAKLSGKQFHYMDLLELLYRPTNNRNSPLPSK